MPRKKQPITWDQALERFTTHLQARNTAPRTLYGHRRRLLAFRAHVRDLPLAAVDLVRLRVWVAGLLSGADRPRPLSAATASHSVTTLRAFFAFLHDERLLPHDPAARLERPHLPPRPSLSVLTAKEIERLLSAPDTTTPLGLRDRPPT